jgi:membrane protease YdiL (CAAX protease family)
MMVLRVVSCQVTTSSLLWESPCYRAPAMDKPFQPYLPFPPEPPPIDSESDASVSPLVIEPQTTPRRSLWLKCALAFSGFFIVYALMLVIGGELRNFAVAGVEAFPFAILVVLAYASVPKGSLGQALTVGYWIILVGAIGLFAMVLAIAGILEFQPAAAGAVSKTPSLEQGIRIVSAVLAMFLAGVAGLTCFLRGIRRRVANLLGIDSESFIHATALATAVAVTLICVIPLLTVNEPPLLTFIRSQAATMPDADAQTRGTLYGLIWAVPASFLAVGYPIRRTFREARQRLALEWPSRLQGMSVVLITTGLVLGVGPLHSGITMVWKAQGWRMTDTGAIEALFKHAIQPLGAVVVSVTAGLGEELVFRGVLQPRLGIVLPALMFTSIHAFQYDFDALIGVLLLGLVLGLVRKKTNTTTCALIHGGYDLTLLLLAYWETLQS